MPRANRNHGLRDLHHVVLCLATATGARSCGTTDRTENEKKYLELALEIRARLTKYSMLSQKHSAKYVCRIGNLRKSVIGPIIRGMILTMNLVQNYSDQFGNS